MDNLSHEQIVADGIQASVERTRQKRATGQPITTDQGDCVTLFDALTALAQQNETLRAERDAAIAALEASTPAATEVKEVTTEEPRENLGKETLIETLQRMRKTAENRSPAEKQQAAMMAHRLSYADTSKNRGGRR